MCNDHFLPGALVFGFSLRKQKINADIICLVSNEVSSKAKEALNKIFDFVINVDEIFIPHRARHQRQDRPFLFTRFNVLRLGENGDLGFAYEKVVLCDADILPLSNYSELLKINAPAGIINESKSVVMKFDESGKYIVDDTTLTSFEWDWHRHYNKICPHGHLIPKNITDKVKVNKNNLGVTACVWVIKPDINEFNNIIKDTLTDETNKLISEQFSWVEQQYATMRWSGAWHNIDLRYASFKGYPFLEALYGTHFAGVKPWNLNKEKSLRKFSRFQDYKKWYEIYIEMINIYKEDFLNYPKLKRLLNFISSL